MSEICYVVTDEIKRSVTGPARMPPDVARSGTLNDWRAGIATAITVPDCPHWTLGRVAGFAGPLARHWWPVALKKSRS